MATDYTPKQLLEIFQKLPQELQDAIFSEETAKNIWDICERNDIKVDEKKSLIAKYVGYLLHGVLPLKDFQEIIEKELKINKASAEKITQEVNQLVLQPIKGSLEKIYHEEIKPNKIPSPQAEEIKRPVKKDSYREPVE